MALKDILNSYKQENDDSEDKGVNWSESVSFKENASKIFEGIVYPTVGESIKVFITAGYTCLPLQKLHHLRHTPETQHLFFSVNVGCHTMQLDFFIDHLIERFVIEATFTNCESRRIEYSVREINASAVQNIVEDFTEYFLRHQ